MIRCSPLWANAAKLRAVASAMHTIVCAERSGLTGETFRARARMRSQDSRFFLVNSGLLTDVRNKLAFTIVERRAAQLIRVRTGELTPQEAEVGHGIRLSDRLHTDPVACWHAIAQRAGE